jgi:hypothetical protein
MEGYLEWQIETINIGQVGRNSVSSAFVGVYYKNKTPVGVQQIKQDQMGKSSDERCHRSG